MESKTYTVEVNNGLGQVQSSSFTSKSAAKKFAKSMEFFGGKAVTVTIKESK